MRDAVALAEEPPGRGRGDPPGLHLQRPELRAEPEPEQVDQLRLLRAAGGGSSRPAGVRRFIYASTSSVYGVSDAPDVTEEHPLVPLTDYNKYKGLCEPILLRYQAPDFTTVIIRPATVCGYSPRLRLDLTVNILTNQAVDTAAGSPCSAARRSGRTSTSRTSPICTSSCWTSRPRRSRGRPSTRATRTTPSPSSARSCADRGRGRCRSWRPIAVETTPSNDLRSYHVSSREDQRELGWTPERTIEDAVRDLCRAFKAGKIPEQLDDDRYFNVKTIQALGPGLSDAATRSSRAAPGSSAATWWTCWWTAGFDGGGDRQPRRRPRRRTWPTTGATRGCGSTSGGHVRRSPPDVPAVRGRGLRVPLRRHRRHRAVHRAPARLHAGQRHRARSRALEAARHAGVRKLVYAASSSCYGLATELPTTESAAIRPEYPYALSKYLGECAALHWGQVYRLPVDLHPDLQRVRAPRADDRRLRGGVRRVPGPEAPRQAVHGGGRRHAAARLRLRDRRGARLPAGGGVRPDGRGLSTSAAAATPQTVNRLVELIGGRGGAPAQAPGRARLHLGRHRRRSSATWAGSPRCHSRRGWPPCCGTSRTGARRRCGRPRRSTRPRGPGSEHLAPMKPDYRAEDQDARGAGRGHRPAAPRAKTVIMCHGMFDIVHPGHLRHLMYAKEQGRHPDRQPHRRRARHQGDLPALRAPGAAGRRTSPRSRWSTT